MLTGAAATVPAIALSAVTEPTAPAEPVVTESPELIELGERLAPMIEHFRMAQARKAEASALYEKIKPARHDDLVVSPNEGWERSLTEGEVDPLTHEPICLKCGRRRPIYRSALIRSHIALTETNGRTKEGRRLHRLARLAKQYEKAVATACKESGYELWDEEARAAARDFCQTAKALLDFEPSTRHGISIYGGALQVMQEAASAAGYMNSDRAGADLGRHLAGALLRIEGRA
jgi:hypothetical protein